MTQIRFTPHPMQVILGICRLTYLFFLMSVEISPLGKGFFFLFLYLCVSILPECKYVHHVHVWSPRKPEESVRSLEL